MSRTVLIVDDSKQHASTLEIALNSIPGLDVALAPSGKEALRYLAGEAGSRVCAVVTDLNMPHIDGFELIGSLRSNAGYRGLPIIAVSGDTEPRTPQRAYDAGADVFFAKPYSPAAIRQALERLLNGTTR